MDKFITVFKNGNLLALIIAVLLILIVYKYIRKNNKKGQLLKSFSIMLIFMFLWCLGLILQIIFSNLYNINPLYFEYFIYISACALPLCFLFTSLIFAKTKIKFKKYSLLLFIIPIISLFVLWTNNYHHLFYEVYSINIEQTVFGSYFIIYSLYSYILYAIALLIFVIYSIKNLGFFSKQSILIIIGSSIPIIINLSAYLNIIKTSIYITPISFTIAVLFYALAIFKFKFLSVTPIALQRVVDRISDSYIVLSEDNDIIDFNDTLLKTFNLDSSKIRNANILNYLNTHPALEIEPDVLQAAINKAKINSATVFFQKDFKILDKYFNIEINSITNKNTLLGVLILFKDVTQHILDLKTIENNQNLLMERERLASLGQLVGGIAHNLKTPIMSIGGAAEGLSDLIKEYDISIGDAEVTSEDHHAIAKDMKDWVDKVKTHISYMSDVITAVKGQTAILYTDEKFSFTVDEVIKRIDILMKHELKNALVDLKQNINVDTSITLNGDVNSLVQVINNMISNAIQAYRGEPNNTIEFNISKQDNNLIFTIKDFGVGMPKSIKDKLFKEMITTKGKNGTGLGLFMSYSTIRGHFNGNIEFESEEGKGSTFNIIIPI